LLVFEDLVRVLLNVAGDPAEGFVLLASLSVFILNKFEVESIEPHNVIVCPFVLVIRAAGAV